MTNPSLPSVLESGSKVNVSADRQAADTVHAYALWLRTLADAAPEFLRVKAWLCRAADLILALHIDAKASRADRGAEVVALQAALVRSQAEADGLRRELNAVGAAYRAACASMPDRPIPFMGRNSASG